MNNFQQLNSDLKSSDLDLRKRALAKLAKLPPSKKVVALCQKVALNDSSEALKSVAQGIYDLWKKNALDDTNVLPQLFPDGRFCLSKAEKVFRKAGDSLKLELLKDMVANHNVDGQDPDEGSSNDDLLPFILSRLEDEKDFTVLAFLVRIGGFLGDTATISFIQPFLSHENARVRVAAIKALAHIGDDLLWSLVVPLIGDRDVRVYTEAAKVLIAFDELETKSLIFKLANSREMDERERACHFISVTYCSWTEALLLTMIGTETSILKEDTSTPDGGAAPCDSGAVPRNGESASPDGGTFVPDKRPSLQLLEQLTDLASKNCGISSLETFIDLRNNSSYLAAPLLRMVILSIRNRCSVDDSQMEELEERVSEKDQNQAKSAYIKVEEYSPKPKSHFFPLIILFVFIVVTVIGFMRSKEEVVINHGPVHAEEDPSSSLSKSEVGNLQGKVSEESSKRVSEKEKRRIEAKARLAVFSNASKEERAVILKKQRITGKRKPRSW
jgi:hypothetical protein